MVDVFKMRINGKLSLADGIKMRINGKLPLEDGLKTKLMEVIIGR